jgi:hypothetical protein
MGTARENLADAMERRAMGDLGLRWTDVATRAGISQSQLLRIRQGAPITPFTAARLEEALDWEPGSIQTILDGGEPTPRGAVRDRRDVPNEEVDDLLAQLERLDAERAETLERLKTRLAQLRPEQRKHRTG